MSASSLTDTVSYFGVKLLQIPHKDLRLLLDELLTAELQVPVNILLRVNVVLLDLWRSLRYIEKSECLLLSGSVDVSSWQFFINNT